SRPPAVTATSAVSAGRTTPSTERLGWNVSRVTFSRRTGTAGGSSGTEAGAGEQAVRGRRRARTQRDLTPWPPLPSPPLPPGEGGRSANRSTHARRSFKGRAVVPPLPVGGGAMGEGVRG